MMSQEKILQIGVLEVVMMWSVNLNIFYMSLLLEKSHGET